MYRSCGFIQKPTDSPDHLLGVVPQPTDSRLSEINPWVVQAEWRGVRFERSLWESEVLKVHSYFTEPLSVEDKYAVKLSVTDLLKISRK